MWASPRASPHGAYLVFRVMIPIFLPGGPRSELCIGWLRICGQGCWRSRIQVHAVNVPRGPDPGVRPSPVHKHVPAIVLV